MGEQFSSEQFEKLNGIPLGLYAVKISNEGGLPVDFIDYFKANAGRWDGQHLEMALLLLRKIDTEVARHEIAGHLGHPLKYIRLCVLGMIDQITQIDDYTLSQVDESLRATRDEFETNWLKSVRDKARQKSVS